MPRAGWTKPVTDHRLSDHLSFAMLTRVFPPDVVDEVIADLGRVQRRNRLLPSRIVVYYVLGLALFSNSSYDEVIRLLIAGQSWSSGWAQPWQAPTKAALYKARLRLGYEPLQALFERVAKPLASPSSGTGFYGSWRVLGIDSVSLDVPDTEANGSEFGKPHSPDGTNVFPSVRVFGLTELGTGAVVGASIARGQEGNSEVASDLIPHLAPGSLVLAGPGFYSPELWAQAAATGADLVWEMPAETRVPLGRRHADGSYSSASSLVPASGAAAERAREVRVIESAPADDADSPASRRLMTTIRDPRLAPAPDLIGLFARGRNLASAFDEFRAYRDSPRIVLRSKMPDGVRQELYGFLCVHYAMRWLMNPPPRESTEIDSQALTL